MKKFENYIDDAWVSATEVFPNINPSNTNDVIGEVAVADETQVQTAIAAANRALPDWSRSGIQARSDCLDRIGNEILAKQEELGALLAREEGKTLNEAKGEVGRAGQIFKYFGGEALRISGELIASVRPDVEVQIHREAVGVVGLITPWNFPIAIPAWKVAPALAYGNTVILKPSEKAPASANALAEIISRSGLPKGVFNLVNGPGATVGQALIDDQRISAVSFTGSQGTGRAIAQACAANNKKFQLEMGGKNPLIVMADADIELALEAALNGAFYSTGQRCTASSRLIIEDAVHDEFVARLEERLEALVVGDALATNTQIGPVIDRMQLEKNLRYLNLAKEGGYARLTGGDELELDHPGHYMKPALVIDTENQSPINQEEVFGPIATTIKVGDLDDAIETANDTRFGLSAGICTSSFRSVQQFKNRIRAGMTMVNLPTAGVDYHVPFGGVKTSSNGAREQGRYAADFYTTLKTNYLSAP